jgi:chromate transport protein ChrA
MSLLTTGLLAIIIVEILASIRSQLAVRGTRQRYVWATIRRTAAWLTIVAFVIIALVNAATGSTVTAVIYTAGATYNIWYELRRHDDDDFWSQTWRKLKRKVRDLRRHGSLSPTPALT